MLKVEQCVELLPDFFTQVFAQNWEQVEQARQAISDLENEADELKKQLRLNLPSGLFMPVARTDLLSLLSSQDKIANKAKDIAGLVTGRQMDFPNDIEQELITYLNQSIAATNQACLAISQLDELLESGFKGKELSIAQNMVVQLDELENESDKSQIALRRQLFKIEQSLPAIDVIFMYKIIEWIGDLADLSQQVGSRLELLLAK